jgi:cholesterol oxidase
VERLAAFGRRAVSSYLGFSHDRDFDEEISALLGPSVTSKSSFPILSMGRDIPNGNMHLKRGLLDVDWTIEESQVYYNRLTDTVRSIAGALNAEYDDNPAYSFLRQVLTAHPLGGCPMGRNADEGVVDSYGAVFGYPGLYIADGSVMPGPVGANPALTIGALSHRFAEHIIETRKGA